MYRVALINMPFAIGNLPSIALTQLRWVLRDRFRGRVECDIQYLNHEFADYLGLQHYETITGSLDAAVCGLGDWFLRQIAFPELVDNTDAYFQRYPRLILDNPGLGELLVEKRQGLPTFIDDLIDRYSLATYDLVGFTSMFVQNVACFAMARKLKDRDSSIATIMGGANCEAPMGPVIARNVEAIDFVFSGPALKTLPQFVQFMLDGETEKAHQIVGVYSRQKLEKTSGNGVHEIGEELEINQIVPLDYDDFLDSIRNKWPSGDVNVYLPFETSRGCWWGERAHCTFCGLNGSTMAYRAMKPELAIAQLKRLFRYHPEVRHFHAVDNILPREYFSQMLPRVRAPQGSKIFYEVKADLNEREMATLAQAGVTEVQPGVEALSTSTLKLMKKGTTAFQNIDFLKNCVTYDIEPSWNLLIGFPGETEDVYQKYVEDIPRLVHLPPPGGTFPVRFDRFSPYFMQSEQYGLQLEPYDSYEMIYPFDRESVKDLAYYFADQNYAADYMQITAKWIRKLQQSVEHWQNRWRSSNGTETPKLELRRGLEHSCVYDSRADSVEQWPLDPDDELLLQSLRRPLDMARIARVLPESSRGELDRRIESFLYRGLVFQEDGRFISLIVATNESQSQPFVVTNRDAL